MTQSGYAAVVRELDGTFDVTPVQFGDPIGREVLVEVRAAGLCHSDLSVASVDRGRRLPLIAGHELAGVVVEVGPDVRTLRVGDHVVGTEVRACGECMRCAAGKPTGCLSPGSLERPADAAPRVTHEGEEIHTLGVSAFASFSLADERHFVRVPNEMPLAQASLLGCGVSTGVGAVQNVARVVPGETVAVFGLGGVGLNIVSGAVISGASRIIAIDVDPAKLELATALGATHTINSSEISVEQGVLEIAPLGVDHAFDAAGARGIANTGLRCVTAGGCVYLIGIPRPGALLEIDTMRDMLGSQRGVRGIYMGGTLPAVDIPRYADFFLHGKLPIDELISEEISIGDINRAYAEPAARGARAIMTSF